MELSNTMEKMDVIQGSHINRITVGFRRNLFRRGMDRQIKMTSNIGLKWAL